MATAGPSSPGTLADSDGTGTVVWSNSSNAGASDDAYAQAALLTSTSRYLLATNFGFSIPAGATIDGILVEIEKNAGLLDTITDDRVRLVKGGTVQSTDKASGTNWPTSDAYSSYGGAADLWSGTWESTDINASNFGVALSATGLGTASVDHMRITITYTEAAATTFKRQKFSTALGMGISL